MRVGDWRVIVVVDHAEEVVVVTKVAHRHIVYR
jgi:mRNA-degrading endonuclease RelE of RelBE toxin-antitoxin system